MYRATLFSYVATSYAFSPNVFCTYGENVCYIVTVTYGSFT